MARGVVYIATTAVQGIIKIGKTETKNFESRMYSLENNGYSNVSGLKRYFAIEVDDFDEKEQLLHKLFDRARVGTSELFALPADDLRKLLESFEGTQIYPDISTNNSNPIKIVSGNNNPSWRVTPLTFAMLNIPVGSTLTYTKDNNVTVVTVDDKNRVSYQGKIYTISGIAKQLNNGMSSQGGFFFTYKGEKLTDIRARLGNPQ